MPVWKYYEDSVVVDFADSDTTAITSNKLEEVYQQNIKQKETKMVNFNNKQIANVCDISISVSIRNDFAQKNGGPNIELEIDVPVPPMSTISIGQIDVRRATIMKIMDEKKLQNYFDKFTIKLVRFA